MERALINSYGTSKLFGARVGKMFSERYASRSSLSVWVCVSAPTAICTEHGFPSAAGARRCGSAAVIRAAPAAIDDERISFGVYNPVSHNPGMRWEIATLARDLGFVHRDGEKMRVAYGAAREAGLGT